MMAMLRRSKAARLTPKAEALTGRGVRCQEAIGSDEGRDRDEDERAEAGWRLSSTSLRCCCWRGWAEAAVEREHSGLSRARMAAAMEVETRRFMLAAQRSRISERTGMWYFSIVHLLPLACLPQLNCKLLTAALKPQRERADL